MPATDGRLEQIESRLAELEAQNCLLEKQWAETEKELVKEKRGKKRTTFYADSFAFGLMGTLVGLEKEVRALKHDLAAVRRPMPTCRKVGKPRRRGRVPLRSSSAWSVKRAKVWFKNHPVFLLSELPRS